MPQPPPTRDGSPIPHMVTAVDDALLATRYIRGCHHSGAAPSWGAIGTVLPGPFHSTRELAADWPPGRQAGSGGVPTHQNKRLVCRGCLRHEDRRHRPNRGLCVPLGRPRRSRQAQGAAERLEPVDRRCRRAAHQAAVHQLGRAPRDQRPRGPAQAVGRAHGRLDRVPGLQLRAPHLLDRYGASPARQSRGLVPQRSQGRGGRRTGPNAAPRCGR